MADALVELFADVLGMPAEKSSDDSSSENTRQWDSLAAMHLVAAIESKFNITLSTKEIMKMSSIGLIVMGEVLEHVERPDIFVRRIAEIAAPGACIFVTTCCNAPAVDHIYLFRNAGEVEKLFADAGLVVKKSLVLPVPGKNLEQCASELLPVNVAYVLEKT